MINRVQPNGPAGYSRSVPRGEGETGKSQESRQIHGASAEVTLSGDALALQRILQAVQNAPDVREDVVHRIQEQLEAGTYQINAETLAEKLLPFLD
jgi:flagellar biosynthesis anti-sigma factor FlgM